jgi:hypothetical protein
MFLASLTIERIFLDHRNLIRGLAALISGCDSSFDKAIDIGL